DFANGLYTIVGQANAWHTGRPMPHTTYPLQHLATLAGYGLVYRQSVQMYLWSALRARQFRLASLIRSAGTMLLPRWSDWLYIHLPPQITWRFERYVLRMHK